ncbi:thioredoxin family protein [Lutibacter citreus]|uniref:thioredoxin family protein n=1 Tax=Lutibacter citreus TaxID=2138210 RepID=UPI000DBE072B|nr:thioredoxin family protein [Lutibacter citreus]
MKKIFLLICISLLNLGCNTSKNITTTTKNNSEDLMGVVTKDNFLAEPYNEWFSYNYNDYKLNNDVILKLNPLLKGITIKSFMGTWCGDSQEQVPIFYKILDKANFNYNNLELIALNRARKTINNLQEGFNIIRVPTFIFYKNKKEIGRIVEYPRENIEKDILTIISGKPYKHSYQD